MESVQNGKNVVNESICVTPTEYDALIRKITNRLDELKSKYYPDKQTPNYSQDWPKKSEFIGLRKLINDTRPLYKKAWKKNHKSAKRIPKKYSGFNRLIVLYEPFAKLIGLPKSNKGVATMSLVTKILNNKILKEDLQIDGNRTHFKPNPEMKRVFDQRPFKDYVKKVNGVNKTIKYNSNIIAYTELQKLSYEWPKRKEKIEEKIVSLTKKYSADIEVIEDNEIEVKGVKKRKVKTKRLCLVTVDEKELDSKIIDWIENKLQIETKINELLTKRNKLQLNLNKQSKKYQNIKIEKDKRLLNDFIKTLKSQITEINNEL